jgi:hypothetical protein
MGVTNYVILTILRHRLHCNCTLITPFEYPGPATLAAACACACIRSWASSAPPKACCCGGAVRMVSGLFNHSSYSIASEIYRLWVPAAEVAVAVTAIRVRFTLINSSLTDTKSSLSSLEIISGEVPPEKSDFSA